MEIRDAPKSVDFHQNIEKSNNLVNYHESDDEEESSTKVLEPEITPELPAEKSGKSYKR